MSTTTMLLRLLQVLERRGRSRSQIYRDVKLELMTPPIRVGGNISVWPDYAVQLLNDAEIAGATVEEIRALVRGLVEQRAQLRPAIGRSAECGQVTAA